MEQLTTAIQKKKASLLIREEALEGSLERLQKVRELQLRKEEAKKRLEKILKEKEELKSKLEQKETNLLKV